MNSKKGNPAHKRVLPLQQIFMALVGLAEEARLLMPGPKPPPPFVKTATPGPSCVLPFRAKAKATGLLAGPDLRNEPPCICTK